MNEVYLQMRHRECVHFMNMGYYDEALAILQDVQARGVRHPALLIDEVRCCQKLRLLSRLDELITDLIRIFAFQGANLDYLGEELQKISLYPQALRVFEEMRKCSEAAERAVGAAREAALHLRLSHVDAAEESLLRAESFHADYPEVRSARAMWLMRKDPSAALPILYDLARPKKGVPFTFTAAHGHHLAKVLDKLGHYQGAIEALFSAKALEVQYNPQVKQFRDERTNWRKWHLDALDFTHQDAKRWRDEAEPWHDHVFLLGHPRSGTTLLEQVLDGHSEVCSIEETNLYAMCFDARITLDRNTQHGATSYAERIRQMNEEQLLHHRRDYFQMLRSEKLTDPSVHTWIDKNPGLSISVGRFAKTMPHSKIIFAVRDPRDVCISSFFQWCDRTPWSSHWLTLEETVEQCRFNHDVWMSAREILAQEWLETTYENLVHNLERCGERVTGFLGLEWQERQRDYREVVAKKVVKSPTHDVVQKDVYRESMQRWRHYKRWLKPFEHVFAPMLLEYGYEP
jgi:tetratricopeptide (TPR) repeat protein